MDKLFTDEFWQNLGALIARHPSVIILLLVLFGLGMIIQRWLNGREITGLKAENSTLEARLKLAEDKQKAVTAPVEILENTKLKEEVAALQTEVAQIKVALPQSVLNQVIQVANTSAVVVNTVRVLSEANTDLGSTLSGSGNLYADASVAPKATSKS
jgi:hypothetical protein